MRLAVPVRVLISQCKSVLDEPEIVGSRLACPNCAGMIEMRSLVWGVFEGSAEELCGLEDHFDDVFVVLGLGCESRVGIENEDVHDLTTLRHNDIGGSLRTYLVV